MPYLKPLDRKLATERGPATPGELNYLLTLSCLTYLGRLGTSYATYNAIVGALECCKQEFYRRAAAPYEDEAKERNGDVYP